VLKRAIIAAWLAISGPGALAEGGAAPPPECEHLLVEVDGAGQVTAGDKVALIEAVRSGQSVQVGFRLAETPAGGFFLTHWYAPYSMTVMGEDVFTHSSRVHLQMPDAEIEDLPPAERSQMWVTLIGTDGILHGRYQDEATPTAHAVTAWWCALE